MDDLTCNFTTEPIVKKKTKHKHVATVAETARENHGSSEKRKLPELDFPPKKLKRTKLNKSGQYFQPNEGKVTPVKNSGVISSLFAKNPEIPTTEEDPCVEPINEDVFSSHIFADLTGIHPHMVANLEQNFGITKMTTVQRLSIPNLLAGQDALIRSQTGSGKTLAYAIPIIQSLVNIVPKLSRTDGIRALVILPTRELALQTYECFQKIVKSFTWIVPGIIAGGERRKSEKARIRKGINILIGTPGRLIDHTQKTKSLSFHLVKWLILDEADKLLDMGYERDITKLVEVVEAHRKEESRVLILPRKQTVLLSATLTPGVERLAGLALSKPAHIDASNLDVSSESLIVPHSLSQKFIVAPAKLRLVTLASFILRKCEVEGGCKMLIFMATQDMVDFHTELFSTVLEETADFLKLHGNMSQPERTDVFKMFRAANSGILLCTDVAARGLDLPKVDWIVQYTAPPTPADYVHRVGRTARIGSSGCALLFLTPEETPFLEVLKNKRIKLNEESTNFYLESLLMIEFISSNVPRKGLDMESAATELQMSFEQAVLQQNKLHELASQAFKSWARFYASYPKETREVFSIKKLHLGHFAKSFALRDAPSTISGIGRPKHGQTGKMKNKRKTIEGPIEDLSRTKRLIISEFDSGLKPLKKN